MKNKPSRLPPKHKWIQQKVKGRTFADVGGLWGTVNETMTIAFKAGAQRSTMIDIQPAHSKWWNLFHERCAELDVEGYDSIIGDVCNANFGRKVGKFDVVHCSGIIYHVPDPISVIRNLVSISNEYLIIGSMLVPDKIENDNGTLNISPGVMHHVPTLADHERKIFSEYFSSINVKVGGLNGPDPRFISPNLRLRTGPWWYLFTAETMRRMCQMFDLTIEDQWTTRQGAQNLLCKVNH